MYHTESLGLASSQAPQAPASPRMQSTYCATELPQWSTYRNPEHQTRRHLENAAEARMKILRRRLEQNVEQMHRPPFIVSPTKWKAEQQQQSLTPPPSRGRSISPFSRSGAYSIEIEITRGRPRSASPMRGGKNNLLVNDFVQWKPAGLYRNLEQRWEADHLSVSERLDKISSLCQDFKHQYSLDDQPQIKHSTVNTQFSQAQPQSSASTVTYRGPSSNRAAPSYLTAEETLKDPRSTARLSTKTRPAPPPASTIVSRPRAHLHSPPLVTQPISSLRRSPSPPSHMLRPSSSPHHLFSPSKSKSPAKSLTTTFTSTKSKAATLAFGHRVIPAAHEVAQDRATLHRTSAFLTESHPYHDLDGSVTFPSMQAEVDSFKSAQKRGRSHHDDLDASWPEIFKASGGSKAQRPLYTLPDLLPEYKSPLPLVTTSSTTKFELRMRSPRKLDEATLVSAVEGLSHRERLQAGIRELQAEMSRLRQDLSPIRGQSSPMDDLASTIPGLGWAVRVPPHSMSPEKMWG